MITLYDSYPETKQDALCSGIYGLGQTFLGNNKILSSVKFYFRVSSGSGDIVAKIYATSGTYGSSSYATGSALATSEIIDASTCSTLSLHNFTFSGVNKIKLTNDVCYAVVIEYLNTNLEFGVDSTSPTHAGNCIYSVILTGYYAVPSDDSCFYLYTDDYVPLLIDSYSTDNYSSAYMGNWGNGQSFIGNGTVLNKASFYMNISGTPTGNVVAKIYASTGTHGTDAKPTGTALATSRVIDASLFSSLSLYDFIFLGSNKIILSDGVCYIVTVEFSGSNFSFGMDNSSPSHGGNLCYTPNLSTWYTNSGMDACFYVYSDSLVIDDYPETNASGAMAMDLIYGKYKIGQSFTGDGSTLDSIKLYLNRYTAGSISGSAVVKIYAHSGTYGTSSIPTGTALATSNNFDVSVLTTTQELVEFSFSGINQITLEYGTYYVLSIEYQVNNGNGSWLQVAYDDTSPTHAGNYFDYGGITYDPQSTFDLIFYVYAKPNNLTSPLPMFFYP